MSYIPKYILRRLFPKDCIKLVNDGIEITFNNVISPLKVEEVPEDFFSNYNIKIDSKEVSKDIMANVKITLNGKEFTKDNLKSMEGEVVPIGGKIKIFAPETEFAGMKAVKGEEHKFHVIISTPGGGKAEYGPLNRIIQ